MVECWPRVRGVPGPIPSQGMCHTKDVNKGYQGLPCLALNIKWEILTLSQIAIIRNNTIFEGLMEYRLKCQISSLVKYRRNKQTKKFHYSQKHFKIKTWFFNWLHVENIHLYQTELWIESVHGLNAWYHLLYNIDKEEDSVFRFLFHLQVLTACN